MSKHTESIIIALIAAAILGGYHYIYVPHLIAQAKHEQSIIDNKKINT